MKHILYTLLACGVIAILASCNGKVREGRVIFGVLQDSSGKAIANHDFNIRSEKRSGFLFNATRHWEEFKFTTDANGFFSASYNGQKNSRVQISQYDYRGRSVDVSYWEKDFITEDAYSAGVIKIKL